MPFTQAALRSSREPKDRERIREIPRRGRAVRGRVPIPRLVETKRSGRGDLPEARHRTSTGDAEGGRTIGHVLDPQTDHGPTKAPQPVTECDTDPSADGSVALSEQCNAR